MSWSRSRRIEPLNRSEATDTKSRRRAYMTRYPNFAGPRKRHESTPELRLLCQDEQN
mgnify:CR=1 FL=1